MRSEYGRIILNQTKRALALKHKNEKFYYVKNQVFLPIQVMLKMKSHKLDKEILNEGFVSGIYKAFI